MGIGEKFKSPKLHFSMRARCYMNNDQKFWKSLVLGNVLYIHLPGIISFVGDFVCVTWNKNTYLSQIIFIRQKIYISLQQLLWIFLYFKKFETTKIEFVLDYTTTIFTKHYLNKAPPIWLHFFRLAQCSQLRHAL